MRPADRRGRLAAGIALAAVAVLVVVGLASRFGGSSEASPPPGFPSATASPAATGSPEASPGGPPSSAPSPRSSATPTARASPSPTLGAGLPAFRRVYLIVLENKAYGRIIGSSAAPYLNGLAARYGLATAWFAVAHPSEPNYLALFSGSTQGVTDDGTYTLTAGTIADQIEAAGKTWQVAAENVPGGCYAGSRASGGRDGGGTYARKHEPAISFRQIARDPARCARITDFSGFDPTAADFSLIVPNLCHDMHDCSVAAGDRFMADFVPRIVDRPSWGPDDLLVVTFDEGVGSDQRVATIVISDRVRAGLRSATRHDHYTFVRSLEDAWGMPCLEHACGANTFAEFFR